jgi:protease-4
MSLEADSILARRRLRRSLGLWRTAAVVAVVAALVAVIVAYQGDGVGKRSNHIARVTVSGLITGDEKTLKLLRDIEKANQVKAVIVRIDSPGGTTAGAEAIYLALRKLSAKKPIAAVMDTVAASGGYITALAADRIVARGNTITGSIGVIFQWAEVKQLLTTLGIKMDEIKSGELKAEPNLFNPPSEKVRAVTNELVQDSFRWFKGLVAERRQLAADRVDAVSDGRIFTGRQALAEKLVDELGGEEQAIKWLEEKKGVAKGLEVRDWEPESKLDPSDFGLNALGAALSALGFGKAFAPERLKLDGLLSVWHPAANGAN